MFRLTNERSSCRLCRLLVFFEFTKYKYRCCCCRILGCAHRNASFEVGMAVGVFLVPAVTTSNTSKSKDKTTHGAGFCSSSDEDSSSSSSSFSSDSSSDFSLPDPEPESEPPSLSSTVTTSTGGGGGGRGLRRDWVCAKRQEKKRKQSIVDTYVVEKGSMVDTIRYDTIRQPP